MNAPRERPANAEASLVPRRVDEGRAAAVGDEEIVDWGRGVFRQEADALRAVGDRAQLAGSLPQAVRMLYACRGRVLVTGLGKSGLIARKVAATLTSTGTPALFVHPVEALHGDLGIASSDDVLLGISRSGDNPELMVLLSSLRALGLKVILITGDSLSPLARDSDVVLDVAVDREACPLNLTPTTSSTAALAMADAVTVALLRLRDFRREDFAVFHPSGVLGRTLLLRVRDLMHQGDELPLIAQTATLRDALLLIAEKRLGCTCVVDEEGALVGFLSDGDLKRILLAAPEGADGVWKRPLREVMTPSPRTIGAEALARAALETMESNPQGPITQLVVVEQGRPTGLLHLHDILRHGLRRQAGTNLA